MSNPSRFPRLSVRWASLIVGPALLLGLAAWLAVVHPAMRRDRESRAAVALGRESLRSGRPALAYRAVSQLPTDGPHAAEALAIKGMALSALGRLEEARRALEDSWSLDPTRPMTAKVLAALYFSRGETQRGFDLLDAAARLDPSDFRPWYGAGDMNRRLDRPADAARDFEQALRRNPDHHESRIGLIWARLATEAPESVAPLLARALRDRPDDPEVHALAARQALALGRPEQALAEAVTCLRLAPDHLEARLTRARVLHAAGQSRTALADAEEAVALDPHSVAALHLLGAIEAKLGMTDRAAATTARRRELEGELARMRRLETEIQDRPDDPDPRWRLGQAAAATGFVDYAERSFRAALSIDPACRPALRGLAALGVDPGATQVGPR